MIHLWSEQEIVNFIAAAMRERRIALSLSQKEAAQKAGLSTLTLSNFERGKNISLKNLISLLIVYEMDATILNAFRNRESWDLEELKRAETRKRVRHGKKD